jgi:hypothetical protein
MKQDWASCGHSANASFDVVLGFSVLPYYFLYRGLLGARLKESGTLRIQSFKTVQDVVDSPLSLRRRACANNFSERMIRLR